MPSAALPATCPVAATRRLPVPRFAARIPVPPAVAEAASTDTSAALWLPSAWIATPIVALLATTSPAALTARWPLPLCKAWIPADPPETDAAMMVVDCEKEAFCANIPMPAVPLTGPVAEMSSVPERSFMTRMPFTAPVTVAAAMRMSQLVSAFPEAVEAIAALAFAEGTSTIAAERVGP